MVAGSLTFTSLLALVPVFTVTLVLTSRLPYMRDMIAQVRTFALKSLVPDVAGKVVTVYMEQFARNAASLTAIGLAMIVVTAVALMFTIDGAFNDIWRARRLRPWWKRLAGYFAVLALGPLLIGAGLTLVTYLVNFTQRFDRVLPFLDDWLLKLASFGLATLALVLAYRVMPARMVPMRHALTGGLVAGLLFEVVKYLFVLYILGIPTYSLVYGAFASVPIFLAWLFCCWMVVLLGAEVAATLSYFRHGDSMQRRASYALPVAEALRIVDGLAGGESGADLNTIRFKAAVPIDLAEDILHALERANLVQVDGGLRYRLALAREAISEEEVVRAIRVPENEGG
jgi:membrane protein